MNDRTRTTLLLSLLAIVAVVVVFDTLRKGAPDADAPTGPTTDFAQRSQDLRAQESLIAQESEWSRIRDERAAQWQGIRDSAVEASTPELAVADFRAMLLDAARSLSLTVDRTDRSLSTPLENVPPSLDRVHTLEVRMVVSSHDVTALHRFVDAVEHLPRVRTHVSELVFDGPGPAQRPERASVTITVNALGITPNQQSTGGGA